ncbi:MAG: hypothetical protein JWN95_2052 [Frankiales bacterium]|nr:hypothetical protein [Frankiales bacterium]
MLAKEELHAPPETAEKVSPCCGRSLGELPRYDRITLDPQQVTCGRLSTTDMLLLSGQPVIRDADNEQIIYSMAATVSSLAHGQITLQHAFESVNTAMHEILPRETPVDGWSAELMVRVTTRAQELATH